MTTPTPVQFFVIGAGKSGTSSLCYHLASHPQVAFCRLKEPNFFNKDREYAKGLSYYESLFDEQPGTLAKGEGTTRYSLLGLWPETPLRIHAYRPQARIIYMVRHPLDRIRSHVRERRGNRLDDPRATMLEIIRDVPAVLDGGYYYRALSTYQEWFSDPRVRVIFFEDLVDDAAAVFEEAAHFLGIDPSLRESDVREIKNPGTEKSAEPAWVYHTKNLTRLGHVVPRRPKQALSSRAAPTAAVGRVDGRGGNARSLRARSRRLEFPRRRRSSRDVLVMGSAAVGISEVPERATALSEQTALSGTARACRRPRARA